MSKYGLIRDDAISIFEAFIKRCFDFIVSFILLIVFFPLIIICSLAIKLDYCGPVFFCQERIGKNGKPFKLYKFRSMKTDLSNDHSVLCSGENDPRLTKVGKFLRLHHLDELPQLWNVFIGNMSFVGWRPEQEIFVDKILKQDHRFKYLFQLKPGITSFATLYNGYTDTIEKMLARLDYDLHYLRTRSLWIDIKILFYTFCNIISGKKF